MLSAGLPDNVFYIEFSGHSSIKLAHAQLYLSAELCERINPLKYLATKLLLRGV